MKVWRPRCRSSGRKALTYPHTYTRAHTQARTREHTHTRTQHTHMQAQPASSIIVHNTPPAIRIHQTITIRIKHIRCTVPYQHEPGDESAKGKQERNNVHSGKSHTKVVLLSLLELLNIFIWIHIMLRILICVTHSFGGVSLSLSLPPVSRADAYLTAACDLWTHGKSI